MSNLKDTDIDDLFRRASDKYPLRTDSADWDRMAAALENKGPEPPDGPVAPEEKRKRRFFWLFLLLLPLAGAGYYTWHHAGPTGVAANTPAAAATTSPATSASTTTTTGANATPGQPATAPTATAPAATIPAATTSAATTPTATTPAGTAPNATIPAVAATQNSSSRFSAAHGRQHRGTTPGIGQNTAGNKNTGNKNTGNENTANDNTSDGNTANDASIANGANSTNSTNSNSSTSSTNALNANSAYATTDRLFYDLQRAAISRDYRLSVNVTAPAAQKDSAAKPKDKTKHFYAGIFGSPDLSTVKMQSVQGVGSTFGLILGYTFKGGRWAVETGAYVDRKKYYTDGEYFNTNEVHLPTNSWLTDVNGICYMWEIPLNVRYNFNPGAKTSWFATAGFSTYLMSHEKYAYGLAWPGSTRPYDSSWNIHKSSQYPFSIINLSAGFEQRLGKIGNLRVEPYVRLPLTGLGTGKLPIMSAGVNIGITRQLW